MSVIEMHSSWLAINSIVGCPNGCKYCLLQATNDNNCFPRQLVSPKEAVNQLLEYKYYDKDIPLCLLPNTDVFVNPKNIEYLLDLLQELENQNIKNDLIIITKCNITDNVIKKVNKIKEKGQNVVFYISYSGLGKDIEPRISEEILQNNFKKLKENNIDVIHYFRPFLPQNSDPKRIEEILNFVNKYTDVSVTTGLALIETFINTKLKRPSTQYYGTEECLNYNHCSKEQRERCKLAHQELKKELIKEKCLILLTKLGFNTESIEFNFDKFGSLELRNIDLKISDASYLSYKLGVKVYISTNKIVSNTYNSTLNGAKPLVLKVGGCNGKCN